MIPLHFKTSFNLKPFFWLVFLKPQEGNNCRKAASCRIIMWIHMIQYISFLIQMTNDCIQKESSPHAPNQEINGTGRNLALVRCPNYCSSTSVLIILNCLSTCHYRDFPWILTTDLNLSGAGASFSKNLKSCSDLKHGKNNGYQGD